jgi:hypothetical protein
MYADSLYYQLHVFKLIIGCKITNKQNHFLILFHTKSEWGEFPEYAPLLFQYFTFM